MPIEPEPLPAPPRTDCPHPECTASARCARSWRARALGGAGAWLVTAALGAEVAPPPSRPRTEVLARPCLACHGTGQTGGSGALALDLTEARFVAAMRAFRDGTRKGSVMDRIARGYGEEDVGRLARFFAPGSIKGR